MYHQLAVSLLYGVMNAYAATAMLCYAACSCSPSGRSTISLHWFDVAELAWFECIIDLTVPSGFMDGRLILVRGSANAAARDCRRPGVG